LGFETVTTRLIFPGKCQKKVSDFWMNCPRICNDTHMDILVLITVGVVEQLPCYSKFRIGLKSLNAVA
jgi:hypothetical protein